MARLHTIAILEHLFHRLPPLVPERLKNDIKETIAAARRGAYSDEEVERYVIAQSKRLWPYRRGFQEFLAWCETKAGEVFLRAHVPAFLRRRCNEFAAHGGTLEQLRQRPPHVFFSDEERELLRHAFLNTARDLAIHAAQAALSTHRHRYEAMVERHRQTLSFIEEELERLHHVADQEETHLPDLSREIRGYIRAVEHGLSALGPLQPLHAVQRSLEHFEGRKREKRFISAYRGADERGDRSGSR